MNVFLIYLEAKEQLIQRQPWDEEQKKEIQQLVDKYPQQASKIDWNRRDLDFAEVHGILTTESKTQVKKIVRQGIPGLVEGKDYHEVPANELPKESNPNMRVFIPYNYKASCAIGRNTKWCTSMEREASHWNDYKRQGIVFFYITIPDEEAIENKYLAVAWDKRNNAIQSVWNAYDKQINMGVFSELTKLTTPFFQQQTAKFGEHVDANRKQMFDEGTAKIPKLFEDTTCVIHAPTIQKQIEEWLEALGVDIDSGSFQGPYVNIKPLLICEKPNYEGYFLDLAGGNMYNVENDEAISPEAPVAANSPAGKALFNYALRKLGSRIERKMMGKANGPKAKVNKDSLVISRIYIDALGEFFNTEDGHTNEWVHKMINGDKSFDFGSWPKAHLNEYSVNLSPENEAHIKHILKSTDYQNEYKDKHDEDMPDPEEMGDYELWDTIEEFDDLDMAVRRSISNGEESGTYDEFWNDLSKAVQNAGFSKTAQGSYTFTVSQADGILPIILVDQYGIEGLFILDEDRQMDEPMCSMSISEPRYGWSGFNDSVFNERLSDELRELAEPPKEKPKPKPNKKRSKKKKETNESFNIFENYLNKETR